MTSSEKKKLIEKLEAEQRELIESMENNFFENDTLNSIVSYILILAIPAISYFIVLKFGSSLVGGRDPLRAMWYFIFLVSSGYAVFFYKGGILKVFFKFAMTAILLFFLWLGFINYNGSFLGIMNKSCKAGSPIACRYAESYRAWDAERAREAEYFEDNFDYEEAERLEKEYEIEKKKWENIKKKHGG